MVAQTAPLNYLMANNEVIMWSDHGNAPALDLRPLMYVKQIFAIKAVEVVAAFTKIFLGVPHA